MIYANTDFFLTLMKESDWLKSRAVRLYNNYKGRIWTSAITLIELLLVCEEYGLDPERLLVDVLEITEVKGMDVNIILLGAHFIKEYNLTVFDALHASFYGESEIISSDRIYDRIGLKRIKLEG